MDAILKAIQEMNKSISDEINGLRTEMKEEISSLRTATSEGFNRIETRLDSLESNVNEDVVALLKQIEKNTNDSQKDIEFLAGKVGNHERIINRFTQN